MRTRYIELGAGPGLFIALFQLPIVIIVLIHMVGGVPHSVAMAASVAGLQLATGILGWYYDGPRILKIMWRSVPFLLSAYYLIEAIELSSS